MAKIKGTKTFNVPLDDSLHEVLKHIAGVTGATMKEITAQGLRDGLRMRLNSPDFQAAEQKYEEQRRAARASFGMTGGTDTDADTDTDTDGDTAGDNGPRTDLDLTGEDDDLFASP